VEAAATSMSIEDMIRGLDGADWNELRQKGHVPTVLQTRSEAIYPFGKQFSVPDWVKQQDVRETWFETIRLAILRECALHQNKLEELQTPEIREALLTLRIYKEDIEFWELYEAELEHMVHRFLKHTPDMPALEYAVLDNYIKKKMPHLIWTAQDTSHALIIIAKIRGQLRPLRHMGFDLNEFTFGCVRNSVPTELRPDVLQSWHRIIDPSKPTHELTADLWRLAAIPSIMEGRNLPLYQVVSVASPLARDQEIMQSIEKSIPLWIVAQDHPSFNVMFEVEGIRPITFDILTERCTYQVFFDSTYVPTQEDKILLLLKQYAYEECYDRSLESVGFLNGATGLALHFEVTSTIREQLSHMWRHLQTKYNLYSQ